MKKLKVKKETITYLQNNDQKKVIGGNNTSTTILGEGTCLTIVTRNETIIVDVTSRAI